MTTSKQYDYLNRLTSIASAPSAASALSYGYSYNNANQRTRVNLADGTFWVYEYDALGQLKSGKRYWSDWTPVAGQQFEYGFDDIGNRTSTKAGGDENGAGLRLANYTNNSLNQITGRDIPGTVDVVGAATATATNVNVNNQMAYRRGEYYQVALALNNGSAAQWQSVTNRAVQNGTTNSATGNVFLPKTAEVLSYDADGNLTNDGRWMLTWDGENHLIKMESQTSAPTTSKRKVEFTYDWQGRLIRRTEHNGSSGSYVITNDLKMLNDGWRCVAELNAMDNALVRSYLWGLDLSGTMNGAGGVGGCFAMNSVANGVHFAAYDGNGNVTALVKGSDGTVSANYEYEPFGQTTRCTGSLAKENPHRFSTKLNDDATDLMYYGYRFFNASTGRWLSRDPIEEDGGSNLYGYVRNDPQSLVDVLGLWETDVHYDIVDSWLLDQKYARYPWRCCHVPVRQLLKDGSDAVDGAGGHWANLASAQSSKTAYQHAMRDPIQTVAGAQSRYNEFLNENLNKARDIAAKARKRRCCGVIGDGNEWAC